MSYIENAFKELVAKRDAIIKRELNKVLKKHGYTVNDIFDKKIVLKRPIWPGDIPKDYREPEIFRFYIYDRNNNFIDVCGLSIDAKINLGDGRELMDFYE